MVVDTGSSNVGTPVYLVSILTPPNVVDVGALFCPIRPLTPVLGGWMDEPGGGAEEVDVEGPADGCVNDRESRSSSSACL